MKTESKETGNKQFDQDGPDHGQNLFKYRLKMYVKVTNFAFFSPPRIKNRLWCNCFIIIIIEPGFLYIKLEPAALMGVQINTQLFFFL